MKPLAELSLLLGLIFFVMGLSYLVLPTLSLSRLSASYRLSRLRVRNLAMDNTVKILVSIGGALTFIGLIARYNLISGKIGVASGLLLVMIILVSVVLLLRKGESGFFSGGKNAKHYL